MEIAFQLLVEFVGQILLSGLELLLRRHPLLFVALLAGSVLALASWLY